MAQGSLFEEYKEGDLLFGLNRPVWDFMAQAPGKFEKPGFRMVDYRPYQLRMDKFSKRGDPVKQKKFLSVLESDLKYQSLRFQGDSNNEMAIVIRKCKSGLSWAAEGGPHAHFLLDEMDMEEVVHKRERKKAVTNSELRSLSRKRDLEGVKKNVSFWRGGKRVKPPWVENPELWSTYHPKSSLPKSSLGGSTTRATLRGIEKDVGNLASDFAEFPAL